MFRLTLPLCIGFPSCSAACSACRVSLLHLPEIDHITSMVIGAAIEVHRHLGPGLLESAYIGCLATELQGQRVPFERQKRLPLIYKGVAVNVEFRIDLLVGGKVIVEVKAIDRFAAVHHAQLLTYLRLTGCPAGLLLNFNVPVLKNGVKRVLNQPQDAPKGPPAPAGQSADPESAGRQ